MSSSDSNSEIFHLRFSNGMYIWPILRYQISIGSSLENIPDREKAKVSKKKIFGDLIKGLTHFGLKRKKIVYITSTLFNVRKPDHEEFFNILDDYYYNVYPQDSVIYEYPADFSWRLPKINKQTFTTFFYLELLSSVLSRFIFKFKRKNSDILTFRQTLNGSDLDFIFRFDSYICIYSWLLNVYFKLTKPKLLVINCGCYGSIAAVIINVAKSRNIKVAEIQHGILGKVAYGLNQDIEGTTFYKDYYPDYLFTFGDYWHDKVTLPVRCISIGHPHLNSYMTNLEWDKRDDAILFVSQPGETRRLLDICIALRELSPIKIIFRLHPIETLTDELVCTFEKYAIILSDKKMDLYSEFSNITAICGSYSFCLYEAYAFKLKVFVVDSEKARTFIDERIGTFITNEEDIIKSINNTMDSSLRESVWASNFEDNYKKFLRKEHILSNGNS